MTDFELMGLALDEARKAAALGEVPVGAVVARNGEVVSAAEAARMALAEDGAAEHGQLRQRTIAAVGETEQAALHSARQFAA